MSGQILVPGCTCDGCQITTRKREMGVDQQFCLCDAKAKTFTYRTATGELMHSNGYCRSCLEKCADTAEVIGETKETDPAVAS